MAFSISLRVPGAGCLALALSLVPQSALQLTAQSPIEEGRTYASGTAVFSEAAGVTFTVPDGWQAQMDAASGLFLMTGQGAQAAVWAYSSGTPDEMAEVIGADLEELGIMVGEDRVERPDDNRIHGTFQALSDAGQGRLAGSVLRGPHGAVIGAAALGAQGADEALLRVVEAVIESVLWSAPAAEEWGDELAGLLLTGGSANSDYAPDGGGNSVSAAGRDDVRIALCANRTYEYASESVFYVSTSAGSVSSGDSDGHTGGWRLVGDVAGTAYLILEPWDRDPIIYEVEEGEGGVLLEGRSYGASGAGC